MRRKHKLQELHYTKSDMAHDAKLSTTASSWYHMTRVKVMKNCKHESQERGPLSPMEELRGEHKEAASAMGRFRARFMCAVAQTSGCWFLNLIHTEYIRVYYIYSFVCISTAQ